MDHPEVDQQEADHPDIDHPDVEQKALIKAVSSTVKSR
jgi:hypothetical protein